MTLSLLHQLDIVLICGLPGSGKSHFCRHHLLKNAKKRINRKEIRRFLYEMTSGGEPWKQEYFNEQHESLVKHVERRIYEQLLHNKEKIVIDNTSVSIESRKNYITIAQQYKKSIGAVFLNTPVQTCLQRNRDSDDPTPEAVISKLHASMRLPDKREGFQEVLIISDY